MTPIKRLTLPLLPRREEKTTITNALKEVRVGSAVQVVLVEGDAGTGKTTLVAQALASVSTEDCWKASTKFDQKGSSLSSLRKLLSNLIDSTLTLPENKSACHVLQKALSQNQLQGLASFVCSAKCLFKLLQDESRKEEKDDRVKEGPSCMNLNQLSKDGIGVLLTTLKACFRTLTSIAPVILFIEDIMWSDGFTLDALGSFLNDPDLDNILVCATVADETGSSNKNDSPFAKWRHKLGQDFLKNQNKNMQTINLDDLSMQQVKELLSDATNIDSNQIDELAETVYSSTNGNLFYIKQYLDHLQDEDLLKFDYNLYQWTWKLKDIKRKSSLSDNVVKVLTSRIDKLPKSTQDVLKLASCFGSQFDIRALDAAKSALRIDCVYKCLETARQEEFVIKLDETHFKFAHDMIQIASYGLLPSTLDVAKVHYDIGSLLLKEYDLLQDDSVLFSTVDHLNLGHEYAKEKDMRTYLAELNYTVGSKAASLSAFAPATGYLQTGIDLLGEKLFEEHYYLALKLYQLCAKTEYCIGEIDNARYYAQEVIDHAKSCEEQESSFLVLISCYATEHRLSELVEFCLGLLDSFGERIPRKPNAIHAQFEYQKMKHRLKHVSEEDIQSLPLMMNKTKELALKVLCQLAFPLYQLEQELLGTLVVSRMVHITQQFGLSKSTPEVLALAGVHLVYHSHDIKQGYKFGESALSLLRRQGIDESNAHVFHLVAVNTKWWLEPVPQCLDLLVEGKALLWLLMREDNSNNFVSYY
jgi:predicted ATPase